MGRVSKRDRDSSIYDTYNYGFCLPWGFLYVTVVRYRSSEVGHYLLQREGAHKNPSFELYVLSFCCRVKYSRKRV